MTTVIVNCCARFGYVGMSLLLFCSVNACAQERPSAQLFYDANGNLTTSVDGLNRPTVRHYDALNRLRQITQAVPGPLQQNPVIRLEMNGRDDVTRIIDPRNLETVYTVNGLGDVTEQVSPDSGLTRRTFDAAGNVRTSRDARGRLTTYTYDDLHRPTEVRYANGASTTLGYDQGVNGKGRLTSMTDPGGIGTAWSYDLHGRVLVKTQTVGTSTHALTYSYNDTTGQMMSITYPSGRVVTYGYGTTSKKVETVNLDGVAVASAISYHPFAGVKAMTLGNGQSWQTTLDQDGRIDSYTLAGKTHSVQWDAANRVIAITTDTPSTDQNYGYDNLDRIIGYASSARSQAFTYDLTGNLLAKSDVVAGVQTDYTYAIDSLSNRMTGITSLGIGYSFDAAGNRIDDGRMTYRYDARGRLNQVRVTNGAVTDTFNYLINGLNLRVRKTGPSTVVPQGTRIFVYDESARLIGEYDKQGRARTEHVWLDERPIAVITYAYGESGTTPTKTTVLYVESDHLGTPRLISNANKRARWSWHSAPYGDTLPNETPAGLGAFTYNLRFPGQYFDKETNHHYNHHRDYESTTGRYLQSDPIGLNGGFNTYLYAHASPIRWIDPTGLDALDALIKKLIEGQAKGFAPAVLVRTIAGDMAAICIARLGACTNDGRSDFFRAYSECLSTWGTVQRRVPEVTVLLSMWVQKILEACADKCKAECRELCKPR